MDSLEYHIEDNLIIGAYHVSKSLGFQSMPDGYALMLDGDMQYFYWLRSDGAVSQICWDKWSVRRGAIKDKLKQQSII